MIRYSAETRRWMRVGITCGLATLVSYTLAIAPTGLPVRTSYLIFMAFGPLFCVSIFAFYRFLSEERPSVALEIGTLLMLVAGGINTLMAAMQGSLRLYFLDLPHGEAVAETTHTAWRMGYHSGNALQLGADMAWDVFVLSGLAVWGLALMRHPRLGPWFAWPALAIGLGGLVLNSATFPTPPAEGELFDIGPFVGLWFTAATVRLIVLLRRSGTLEAAENA